jgi:WD40 repeat protein
VFRLHSRSLQVFVPFAILALLSVGAALRIPAGVNGWAVIETLVGSNLTVVEIAFSPDGQLLAAGHYPQPRPHFHAYLITVPPNELVVWDISSRNTLGKWQFENGTPMLPVEFSSDGRILYSSKHRAVVAWDIATRLASERFSPHSEVDRAMALSVVGKKAAWSDSGGIRVADFGAGEQVVLSHPLMTPIQFSHNGELLAAWDRSNAKKVVVWNLADKRVQAVLDGHTQVVKCVRFSPDGNTIATAGWDQTARIWDAQTGRELATLGGHSNEVECVAFSPDGATLMSGSYRYREPWWSSIPLADAVFDVGSTRCAELKFWDVDTGKERATILYPAEMVSALTFSPDGEMLAVGYWDGKIELREMPDFGQ